MYILQNNATLTHWQWWQQKQADYNKGLLASGVLAFVIYSMLGSIIIAPHEEFEVTLPIMIVQGLAYLMIMVAANICYLLGYLVNIVFNRDDDHRFLSRLFAWGFWFSCALPVVFILTVMVYHLFKN